jgi:hypothetical protein
VRPSPSRPAARRMPWALSSALVALKESRWTSTITSARCLGVSGASSGSSRLGALCFARLREILPLSSVVSSLSPLKRNAPYQITVHPPPKYDIVPYLSAVDRGAFDEARESIAFFEGTPARGEFAGSAGAMGLREFCRDEQTCPQQVEGAELPLSTHTPPEATIKCRPLRTASRKQFDLLSKSWRPVENRFIVEKDRSGPLGT